MRSRALGAEPKSGWIAAENLVGLRDIQNGKRLGPECSSPEAVVEQIDKIKSDLAVIESDAKRYFAKS